MVQDLALQRNKYKHLSDEEWRWFLQQVEGRERTADKLPTFAAIDDWWYPVRLSCEQCSSEATARYKASLCQRSGLSAERSLLDLTGGYGVDTYFLSEQFDHTDYVEQNAELCRIAEHNFSLQDSAISHQHSAISIHNTTAEDFLLSSPCGEAGWGLIFLDPARRDSHGGKVFKLADCTPNVVELLPTLLSRLTPDGRILLKLSPMIDLTQALKELQTPPNLPPREEIIWDIHIVAVKNEVKEVLLMSRYTDISKYRDLEPTITAIDLAHPEQAFTFTREEERDTTLPPFERVKSSARSDCRWPSVELPGVGFAGSFLFEPNAAILKAGAYKLVAQRFGLQKLDVNTHLYTSETLIPDFPGRVWRIKEAPFQLSPKGARDKQANVLCRNYPLTAEQLKKKLHLRDGGTVYIIGCRVAGKPTIFLGERVS